MQLPPCKTLVIFLRQLSPASSSKMSAKTLYPDASSRGASQSVKASSPGVALDMKTIVRSLSLLAISGFRSTTDLRSARGIVLISYRPTASGSGYHDKTDEYVVSDMTKLCKTFHVRKSRATTSPAEQVGRCRRWRLRPCHRACVPAERPPPPRRPVRSACTAPPGLATLSTLRAPMIPTDPPGHAAAPVHRSATLRTRIETHPASPCYPPFTPISPTPRDSLRRSDRFAGHLGPSALRGCALALRPVSTAGHAA